jgi:hypothetical protein
VYAWHRLHLAGAFAYPSRKASGCSCVCSTFPSQLDSQELVIKANSATQRYVDEYEAKRAEVWIEAHSNHKRLDGCAAVIV